MGEHPAELWDSEGRVILSPDGVRLVLGVLTDWAKAKGVVRPGKGSGGVPPSTDLGWVWLVLRLAEDRARGCVPATTGEPFVATLPGSDETVTVAEAAKIRGVSPQAIRKQIAAGKLPARRQGSQWVVQEQAVREAAGRRRRGHRGDRAGGG